MILRIFNKDLPLRNLLFVTGEGMLIYVSVLMAALIRFGTANAAFLSSEILGKALVIMVVCQVSLYYNDLYDLKVTDTYLELGLRMTKALGIATIVLAILYYCVPFFLIGRGIFFVSVAFLILLVVSWRYVYSWIVKRKMLTEKIMILGSGNLFTEIINEIGSRPYSGYEVAGVISANSASPSAILHGMPILESNQPLCELVDSLQARKIVVAMDERRGKLPGKELLDCKIKGIEITEGQTLYEALTGKIFVERLNPSWLIFSEGFHKSSTSRLVQRLLGFSAAAAGLLLILPLIALIAVAIKLDSKGPVLFMQDRCGEDGRIFHLYKFRSMVDNAEEYTGARWAEDDDSRVTRVGRILRRYRLDEIAQMWNVLKGDMSFIGPRPERPEFVGELVRMIPYYSQRNSVKPGITGWAQVSYGYGASVQDAIEKLKYDLFYIKNVSLVLDLVILWKTVKIVLLKSGAR
jgi:sugar transferase (PEP-CTERM system associated)